MNVIKYINPYYQNTVIRNKVPTERKICGCYFEEKNCEIKCGFLLLLIMSHRYVAHACHVYTQTEISELWWFECDA
jgi:hypothetical protein